MAYSITPLPPTVTNTWTGSTAKPLRAEASAAIASRRAGMPGERRVVRRAGVERRLGRLADVGRRVEVGLADLEVDDRAALGLERAGAGGHLERALGADRAHPCRDPHGLRPPTHGSIWRSANQHVGRPLRESAHVPRIPVLTVGDEGLDAIARSCQAELLVGPDAVEHLDLEPRRARSRRHRPARRSAR